MRGRISILTASILLGCVLVAVAGDTKLRLLDLEGRVVDPFARESVAKVFVFTLTDCPISNRYAPELHRLHDEFQGRGVEFWLVYPDPSETVAEIRTHLQDYGYPFPALRDPGQTLVALTGVEVTPEAALFDASGRLVYRGRIDDLYVAFGKRRAEPTRRDLEEAVEATLAGRRIEPATTKAVGCYIPRLE